MDAILEHASVNASERVGSMLGRRSVERVLRRVDARGTRSDSCDRAQGGGGRLAQMKRCGLIFSQRGAIGCRYESAHEQQQGARTQVSI